MTSNALLHPQAAMYGMYGSMEPRMYGMYGSLEPRDFKANSKHDSKSKHDSLLADLL